MDLKQEVIDALLNADAKALATCAESDINVIPVSSARVVNGKIWLINYFLSKTLKNIERNPRASLVFWKGLNGYQVKGTIAHYTEGSEFDAAKKWIAEILPDRTVKGLMILEPSTVFNVSPSAAQS